jgi:very-short-patch-repair endonuclease
MNGGEHYLKDLGYWVDAYDKDKNVVIEYDEGQHNKKKDADVRRMNEIKQKLGCKFLRYDAVSEELKEY